MPIPFIFLSTFTDYCELNHSFWYQSSFSTSKDSFMSIKFKKYHMQEAYYKCFNTKAKLDKRYEQSFQTLNFFIHLGVSLLKQRHCYLPPLQANRFSLNRILFWRRQWSYELGIQGLIHGLPLCYCMAARLLEQSSVWKLC